VKMGCFQTSREILVLVHLSKSTSGAIILADFDA
jgi:hypothetical protein